MKFKMLKVTKEDVNIRNICQTIFKLLKRKAELKNIGLKLNIEKRIPEIITSDKNRLRQILFNLVGNAIKFTKKGYVEIRIKLVKSENFDELPNIKISVIDTGIGIKEKD